MKRKPRKKRRILIIIAVLLAGILTGTAAFGYMYFNQNNDGDGPGFPDVAENPTFDKRVSFLLIGADKRPGDNSFNADSLIVVSVDPDTKIISMLSIPRDTRIPLGSNAFVKINSVPMLRGIPELKNQVTELTGIPLDGYVLTNFEGFKTIIDTLGGITIYVEKRMGPFHTGDKVDGLIDLQKGEQWMTGSLALQYARWRNDDLADIGRTARQQNVLKAVAKETLQASTITKLPKLIPQIMDVVETDLKLADMLKLSKVAASFDSSNIVNQTLPGVGLYLDNISYWEVNRELAKEISQNLLLGITTDKVFDNLVLDLLDPNIKAHITVPGSSKDPNGTKSPGHQDAESKEDLNPPGNKKDPGQNSSDESEPDQISPTDNNEEDNREPDDQDNSDDQIPVEEEPKKIVTDNPKTYRFF